MTDHDAREAQDSAALTAARAIYGNSFDPAVHVVQFDTMRQAARAILASLPAPAPAAYCNKCGYHGPADKYGGHNRPSDDQPCFYMAMTPEAAPAAVEAVAWQMAKALEAISKALSGRVHSRDAISALSAGDTAYDAFMASQTAPQPPEQCANIAQKSEQSPATGGFDWRSECEWLLDLDEIHVGEEETEVLGRIARIRAALANHSPDAGGVGDAAADVIAERTRQVQKEGWTPEHDDEHRHGFELARAAACYALADAGGASGPFWITHLQVPQQVWPYRWEWKPGDRRRNLVKAGALILAEIERLDRAALRPGLRAGEE